MQLHDRPSASSPIVNTYSTALCRDKYIYTTVPHRGAHMVCSGKLLIQTRQSSSDSRANCRVIKDGTAAGWDNSRTE